MMVDRNGRMRTGIRPVERGRELDVVGEKFRQVTGEKTGNDAAEKSRA